MKYFFLLLFVTAHLHADPSRYDCEFYKEVEKEFSCGPHGYLRKFGIPLCEKYLKAGPYQTENLSEWFRDVRFCLQDELSKNLNSSVSCGEIRMLALSSHVGCYRATGFCDLSVREKLTVVRLTSMRLFSREALDLARQLPAICP